MDGVNIAVLGGSCVDGGKGKGEVERKAWCGIHCVEEKGIMRRM